MLGLIILGSFIAMVVISFVLLIERDLANSVVLFMGVGLAAVVLFLLFNAPDVALTEAVIGAGVGSVIFLMGLKHLQGTKDGK